MDKRALCIRRALPILVRTPVLSILEEVGVRSFVHYFSGSSKAAGASFYFR